MQRDHIGARQEIVERDQLDAVVAVVGGELDIGVGDQDAAAEGLQQPHDLGADIAIADDADGHFGELAAGAVGAVEVAAPFAPAQRLVAARMRRVSARIAPMVNSATALALRPGVLTTMMPCRRAAAMSILTGPPRDTATSFSVGQALHHAVRRAAQDA